MSKHMDEYECGRCGGTPGEDVTCPWCTDSEGNARSTECNACNGELPEHEDDCSRNDEDDDEDGGAVFTNYPGQIFLVPGQGFVGN